MDYRPTLRKCAEFWWEFRDGYRFLRAYGADHWDALYAALCEFPFQEV